MVNVTPEQVLTETVRHVALKLVIPVKQPLTLLVQHIVLHMLMLNPRLNADNLQPLSRATLVEVVRH